MSPDSKQKACGDSLRADSRSSWRRCAVGGGKLLIAWTIVVTGLSLLLPVHEPGHLTLASGFGLLLISSPSLPRGVSLMWKAKHATDKRTGKVALAVGILGPAMGVLVCLYAFWFMAARGHSARLASCQYGLKQLGLVVEMYAEDSPKGLYPELSSVPGRLMFTESIYPKYLNDLLILLYHANSDGLTTDAPPDDGSYFYLGYAVTSDDEVNALATAYKQRLEAGLPFDDDLPMPDGHMAGARDVLPRLRTGVERIFLSEGEKEDPEALARIRSQIPVFIERVGHHRGPGANVVFLDNHVESIRYPGKWPMSEGVIAALAQMESLGTPHESSVESKDSFVQQ